MTFKVNWLYHPPLLFDYSIFLSVWLDGDFMFVSSSGSRMDVLLHGET